MKTLGTWAVVAISMLSATFFAVQTSAQPIKPAPARNVVLVHGAWADGSSWAEVIPRLQAAGLRVTAVQNPLTSLADSVAAPRLGSAGWTDRAGRSFMGRHSHQRNGNGPEGHGARLRCSTCT